MVSCTGSGSVLSGVVSVTVSIATGSVVSEHATDLRQDEGEEGIDHRYRRRRWGRRGRRSWRRVVVVVAAAAGQQEACRQRRGGKREARAPEGLKYAHDYPIP